MIPTYGPFKLLDRNIGICQGQLLLADNLLAKHPTKSDRRGEVSLCRFVFVVQLDFLRHTKAYKNILVSALL
jgi:hypothetical protein